MPKILLIEDNEMNLDMLSRRLRRRGYEVLAAVDGAEGVEKAKAELPDLVLMDMSLPVMDGYQATRLLKANEATRHIPILGLSAHAMTGDAAKALEAGCDDYDTKPVQLKRLLGKMEELLEGAAAGGSPPAPTPAPSARRSPTNEGASGPTPSGFATAGSVPGLSGSGPMPTAAGSPAGGSPSQAPRPGPLQSAPPAPAAAAEDSSRGRRILVAGGSPEQYDAITALLGQLGHEARHVRDEASALGLAERGEFDALFVDHRDPALDPDRLIPELKNRSRSRSLPIVVVTSTDELSNAFRCIRLGAEAYLPFPFSVELLAMRLRFILEKRSSVGS